MIRYSRAAGYSMDSSGESGESGAFSILVRDEVKMGDSRLNSKVKSPYFSHGLLGNYGIYYCIF